MSAIARIALPLSLFVVASRESVASQRYSPALCRNRIDSVSRSRPSLAQLVCDKAESRRAELLAKNNLASDLPAIPIL
jgi:hypothetical protein